MSKPVFRATVTSINIGADRYNGAWHCDHEHKELRAAARCGQLELRRRLPSSGTQADLIRFEEIRATYEVRSEATGGEWVNAAFYRQYVIELQQ